jgi:hypothetical protein
MAKKFFRMKAQPAMCHIEEDELAVLFNDGVSVPDDQKVDLFGEQS